MSDMKTTELNIKNGFETKQLLLSLPNKYNATGLWQEKTTTEKAQGAVEKATLTKLYNI
jgi:hypothetical protein